MNIIETEKFTKYYGKTRGIESLALTVEEGEIFGFLGPNGAGKTTTIRLLLNLIRPTGGKAFIFGLDTRKETVKIKHEVGYLPGDVHLYDKMTGAELIHYIDRFQPQKPAPLRKSLIERLDLDTQRRIKGYSKGMRQKLAVIIALMHDPKLLILDEPTIGLDPLMQQEVYRIVREFKERGRTIFLSSHILPEVERTCDRVGIVRDGHLIAVEKVEDIHHKKIRHIEISFARDINPANFKLPKVDIISYQNHNLRLAVKGNLDALIKKVAQYEVRDILSEQPDLEDIFMEYYVKKRKKEEK